MSAHTEDEKRPVPTFTNFRVDASGGVWSFTGWRGESMEFGFRLTPTKDRYGYLKVRLSDGKRRYKIAVHRLVAFAFHGPPPTNDHEVRHLNGDRTDNRAANLAWGTRAENAADRETHGRTSRGESHSEAIRAGIPNALTEEQRGRIIGYRQAGLTQRDIAAALGCSQSAVRAAIAKARGGTK